LLNRQDFINIAKNQQRLYGKQRIEPFVPFNHRIQNGWIQKSLCNRLKCGFLQIKELL